MKTNQGEKCPFLEKIHSPQGQSKRRAAAAEAICELRLQHPSLSEQMLTAAGTGHREPGGQEEGHGVAVPR